MENLKDFVNKDLIKLRINTFTILRDAGKAMIAQL